MSFPASQDVSCEDVLLVCITVPDESGDGTLAFALARRLVESRLAAGVNVLAVAHSIYRWQNEVCEAEERVLLAQVAKNAFADFCAALVAQHPHITPCVLGLGVTAAHAPFVRWIAENSASSKSRA